MTMILIATASINVAHLPACARLMDSVTRLIVADVGGLKTSQSMVNVAWSLACLDKLDKPLLDQVA